MIDYTQYAFASPPEIVDPLPSVADYIDQYRINNEAWYDAWAYPIEPGQWGSRPSSFERRAPYISPEPSASALPADVLPPAIRRQYGAAEDNRVMPEDRPVGALVRDVSEMSIPDLFAEREALYGPMGYAGSVASAAIPGGIPVLPSLMSGQGVEDRIVDLEAEIMFRADQPSALPNLFLATDSGQLSPPPSPGPSAEQVRAAERVQRDQNAVQEQIKREVVQKQKESRSDADRDNDRGYGGGSEVGAGGWAGSGGL